MELKGQSTIFALFALRTTTTRTSPTNPTVQIQSSSSSSSFIHSPKLPFSPLVLTPPTLPLLSSSLYSLLLLLPLLLWFSLCSSLSFSPHGPASFSVTMSSAEKERETQVYMAKLAEQAERYDGTHTPPSSLWLRLFLFFSCIVSFLSWRYG